MNVVVTIQHPAHVHFFKNAIRELAVDESVYVFVRENDIATDLLTEYGIEHEVLAGRSDSFLQLARTQLRYERRLLERARQIEPDVMAAIGEPGVAHVSRAVGSTSLVFTDTEHATLQNALAFPFSHRIYTPTCYKDSIGDKQIEYPGYHELAYLHPERFDPDPSILSEIDATEDETLVIMRLVSWDAAHDVGNSGFDGVHEVVSRLEAEGARVLITSESRLPPSLERCRITVAPHRVHHLMYYADLFIGESPTMATESAVLGTPAIYISSIELGYVDEISDEYGLIFNFYSENREHNGLRKAVAILSDDSPTKWERRREALLEAKLDTTSFMLDEIYNAGRSK
ncbi:DUF354 domain-containing protein [Salinadaptatus halalkaliphilus]|uniref:DUF354 domain-containing protein n=1 Tax=Salinadaptatus halalkaliphilus TaxID=2419781 RepID=A0A4S3TLU4_9EURY|nr:DUF354 domain-containing protein [Salinadaptatus halalkaliphilus]THE65142.1 DUF354 domain-containing protein [Salinadaptatus halalkaliphilus]